MYSAVTRCRSHIVSVVLCSHPPAKTFTLLVSTPSSLRAFNKTVPLNLPPQRLQSLSRRRDILPLPLHTSRQRIEPSASAIFLATPKLDRVNPKLLVFMTVALVSVLILSHAAPPMTHTGARRWAARLEIHCHLQISFFHTHLLF